MMTIRSIIIAVLFVAVCIAGCGKVDEIKELYQKINRLEQEKRDISESLNQKINRLEQEKRDISESLSQASATIGRLREENSTLKSELTKLADKHKKNLEHLFR